MPDRPRPAAPVDPAGTEDRATPWAVAATCHDLRQPLHALQAHAAALALLAGRRQDDDLQRLADGLDRALRQAHAQLDTLADLSRLDAGLQGPALAPVDLPALLAQVVADHAPVADARGLRLDHAVDAHAPHQARTDARLLCRLLDNLVANALRCTPAGHVRLHLAAGPGGRACITVADTGPGLPPRAVAQLLGTSAADDALDTGPGLGLQIVRRLAQWLDVELGLDHRPGDGARVVLRLPAG